MEAKEDKACGDSFIIFFNSNFCYKTPLLSRRGVFLCVFIFYILIS
jgi:hypothetical protein